MARIELAATSKQSVPSGNSRQTGDATSLWRWVAVAGFVLCLLSVPAYMSLIDVPLFRSTGIPAFACILLGCGLAFVAARREPRSWVKWIAGLNFLGLAFSLVAFFGIAAVPGPTAVAMELTHAPDFTLKDEKGQTVSLSSAHASGPVLLVFYRGHW